MTDTRQFIQLGSGRRLGVRLFGDPKGVPYFYFHGTPGSRFESMLIDEQARRRNLLIISLERPGYGLSDFDPQRRLLDWPEDVRAAADALKIERFGIIGVSGGGPYALACAYALAGRMTRVAVVCGLGPVFRNELLRAMPRFSQYAFRVNRAWPGLFRLVYGKPLSATARLAPNLAVRILAGHCGGDDRRVILQPHIRRNIAVSLHEAFRQGAHAAAQDMQLYQTPWGFDPAHIDAEILLWHGMLDPVVPPAHSEFLADKLRRSRLWLVEDAGHFSLPIEHAGSILDRLNPASRDTNLSVEQPPATAGPE